MEEEAAGMAGVKWRSSEVNASSKGRHGGNKKPPNEGRRMHLLGVCPQSWEHQENGVVGKLFQFSWVVRWTGCLSELPAGQVLSVQSFP